MNTTKGMTIAFSAHALKQAQDKGFSRNDIMSAFNSPTRVYPNGKKYPGQYRVCGAGICLVGRPEGRSFVVLTMYADGVLTPPRADQLNTPEGRRYAERYEKGLGRG